MQHAFHASPCRTGWIEVICGSMYCGKTEELIRRIRRAEIARQVVQVFKPILDSRYVPEDVSSHSGRSIRAIRAEGSHEIALLTRPETHVVAIDEIQFFDEGVLDVVQALADAGKRVVCSGLDLDFRGQPFGFMPRLLAIAEQVEKFTAICVQCGAPATRSQRLIDGQPARWDDPIILVGAAEAYEPRCRACHVVPVDPSGVSQLSLTSLESADPSRN